MNTPSSPAPPRSERRDVETHQLSVPCVRSDELLGKQREIIIQHGDGFYRLRLTHSNKLILTK